MISRSGFIVTRDRDIEKALTVTPEVNSDYAPRGIPFKVFRRNKDNLCIPQHYGKQHVEANPKDKRPDPISYEIPFSGKLRKDINQPEAVRAVLESMKTCGGGVLSLPCGFGKCHAKDTPIMLHSGKIKMVQDIRVNDQLMGDDSTPRNVLSLAKGREIMYKIIPTKGDPYIVNESHILSLKVSGSGGRWKKGEIVDISVKDYLNLPKSYHGKGGTLLGWRTGVEFPEKELPFDPYIIGLWLGDGSSRHPSISCGDKEILDHLSESLKVYNLKLKHSSKYDYYIVSDDRSNGVSNKLNQTLKQLNLIMNKHIPDIYKYNSKENRLKLLAGLIDSDGYQISNMYDLIQKNEKLFDDILYLVRSLGFAAYKSECQKSCVYKGEKKTGTYFRMSIHGRGLEQIPVILERKKVKPRTQIKDVLVTRIRLEKLPEDDYYGFEIDGNHRFLLGDFTVTHNTVCAIKIASKLGVRTMIMVHKEFLANQWKQRIEQFCPGMTVGRIQKDKFEIDHPFVIGMLQTFTSRDFPVEAFESIGLVIVDEAHHICARVFSQSMLRMCPKYTLGLSATPERKDGLTNVLYWFLGPQAYMVERKQDDEVTMDAIKPKLDIYYQPFPTSRFGKVSMAEAITMLVEDAERNRIILEKMNDLRHRKVLILTDRRDHCFWLKENIPDSGLYIGGMKEADLDESATKMVIIGTFNMAHEGLDIGDVDTVFMVTPKSDVVQAVGRCMREGGSRRNPPKIIDLHDNWGPFDAMYYKRRKIYRQLGIIKDVPKKEAQVILDFLD
jgi:superfamily II DNA or RNA helicase